MLSRYRDSDSAPAVSDFHFFDLPINMRKRIFESLAALPPRPWRRSDGYRDSNMHWRILNGQGKGQSRFCFCASTQSLTVPPPEARHRSGGCQDLARPKAATAEVASKRGAQDRAAPAFARAGSMPSLPVIE